MYACEQREKAQRDWKSKSFVARDEDMVKGELKGRVEEKNRNSRQPAQYEHAPERYPKRYRSFLERNTVSDIALAPCSSLHCFPADTWWSVVKRRNVSKSIQSFLLSIISFW